MVEDDGLVCADSGSEDYELFFGPIPNIGEMAPYYDAQDGAYDESDGPIKRKRRKDVIEKASRGNKQKTFLKRNYKKGHCHYCDETCHTKRNCGKRAVDEESAAVVNGGEVNNSVPTTAVNGGDDTLTCSETDDSQQVQLTSVRPTKLLPKKELSTPKNSTPSTSIPATTTQLASTPPASTPSASIPPASTNPPNPI
ncbi:hypothetical protein Ahy_A03g016532 [Arachis hypogaea]|uniref:Uncharacterized protein n=1 Tax=Arachis hypogaea TaxID=3818 RepID=A0A445E3R1_ARAHY|nr:hypothetical protein Ahy_A03g016532 [Arachis hypogaea]